MRSFLKICIKFNGYKETTIRVFLYSFFKVNHSILSSSLPSNRLLRIQYRSFIFNDHMIRCKLINNSIFLCFYSISIGVQIRHSFISTISNEKRTRLFSSHSMLRSLHICHSRTEWIVCLFIHRTQLLERWSIPDHPNYGSA